MGSETFRVLNYEQSLTSLLLFTKKLPTQICALFANRVPFTSPKKTSDLAVNVVAS